MAKKKFGPESRRDTDSSAQDNMSMKCKYLWKNFGADLTVTSR